MPQISIKKPAKEKPQSRFQGVKEFAIGEASAGQVPASADLAPEAKPKKAKAEKQKLIKPREEETTRENFDMPISQRAEMMELLIHSKRFRYKRDFLIQCVEDGLKKYKGQ